MSIMCGVLVSAESLHSKKVKYVGELNTSKIQYQYVSKYASRLFISMFYLCYLLLGVHAVYYHLCLFHREHRLLVSGE